MISVVLLLFPGLGLALLGCKTVAELYFDREHWLQISRLRPLAHDPLYQAQSVLLSLWPTCMCNRITRVLCSRVRQWESET